jgi:peptidoglycan hydrolase-like protein with peptidoglycan-binding domain
VDDTYCVMQTLLKLGSSGDDVTMWQNFLKGIYSSSSLIVNGSFDNDTQDLTKKFQHDNGLNVDGVVGQNSYAVAKKLGFGGVATSPVINSINPITAQQRAQLFGTFSYVPSPTPDNPEAITINHSWVISNIISVQIPELSNIPGAPKNCIIPFNKLAAPQLSAMFQAWNDANLINRILSWDGSWAPRFIRGSRTNLSNHAWGTAFDINARWNRLGAAPATAGMQGCVLELVDIANQHGFFWGGSFATRPDGMHFECATLK